MKKLFLIFILLVSTLLLTSCGLLGGGEKGKEITADTWNKLSMSFADETNFKIERTSSTVNVGNKNTIYSYKDSRYRDGTVGYYYSKSEGARGEREGDDWYLVYEHKYGFVNEDGVFTPSSYDWNGDPEGTFRYDDHTGDYPMEYYANVSDEKLFGLNFLSVLPAELFNLGEFSSVTWNTSKGCYTNSSGGEYYFNENGKLFKYVYAKEYQMGINNMKDTVETRITYGDAKLDKCPAVKSVRTYYE